MEEYIENRKKIVGIVTKINKDRIDVTTKDSVYKLQLPYTSMPIWIDDILATFVDDTIIIEPPTVIIPDNPNIIIKYLKLIFEGETSYIKSLMKTNKTLRDFNILCLDNINTLCDVEQNEDLKWFAEWWYDNIIIRQLKLWSLSDKDIIKLKPITITLLDRLKRDPRLVIEISETKANNISKLLGIVTPTRSLVERREVVDLSAKIYRQKRMSIKVNNIKTLDKQCLVYYGFILDKPNDTVYYAYPHREYYIETEVANYINYHTITNFSNYDISIDEEHINNEGDYSRQQLEAICSALTNKVSIITGMPGTGKTTIIKGICHILDAHKVPYAIVSPTGKVVSNIIRSLGKRGNVFTLHKLINAEILNIKYVIFDESSMIQTWLFWYFLFTYKLPLQLVFIGDIDQLQPIREGKLFKGLLQSNKIPTIRLTYMFRFEHSTIYTNLERIISGKGIIPDECFKVKLLSDTDGIEVVKDIILSLPDLDTVMILSPYCEDISKVNKMFQTIYDVGEYNMHVQDDWGNKYRVGDKVMNLVNNYDKDIMNGDDGVITKIDVVNETITVEYKIIVEEPPIYIIYYKDRRKCKTRPKKSVEKEEIGESKQKYVDHISCITLCYCITIHKAQGSQRKYVIVYIKKECKGFLNRELFYTACSRAETKCIVIATYNAFNQALYDMESENHDTLKYRIK